MGKFDGKFTFSIIYSTLFHYLTLKSGRFLPISCSGYKTFYFSVSFDGSQLVEKNIGVAYNLSVGLNGCLQKKRRRKSISRFIETLEISKARVKPNVFFYGKLYRVLICLASNFFHIFQDLHSPLCWRGFKPRQRRADRRCSLELA